MKRLLSHYPEISGVMRDVSYYEWLYLQRLGQLTKTERRFCASLRLSQSIKQAAAMLDISILTAETHCRNIKRKLGITGKGDLYTFLLRQE